jgi:hypothetical protein
VDAALWIGPVIVAAAIAGLINVAGWFVTFRHTRRLEQERRAEKVTDVQTALLAEIRSDLRNLRDIDVSGNVADIAQMLRAAPPDQPYTPFVPRDSGTPVFSAIVGEIAILPTAVIDPVVLYYKQRDVVGHFTEDLRADDFAALPGNRKLAMMEDYLSLKAHAGALARDAVSALERSLGLPPSLNNRVSAQSGPQSASGGAVVFAQTSSISNHDPYKSD